MYHVRNIKSFVSWSNNKQRKGLMQDTNQDPQVNNKKLYFGNLPFSMTDDALTQLVGEFGEVVEVKVITDFRTGRSKGFAFVEFVEEDSAKAAMEALAEKEVDGRKLFVKVARPKAPRRDFGGGNGGGRRDFGRGRDNRNSRRDY